MIKKILFPIFSAFLAYRSFELLNMLISSSPANFSFLSALSMSAILNLFITGVFAFPGFVFATHRFLPNSYYQIKNPKLLNRIYDLIGVAYFKIFLLVSFWGKEKNKKKYFNGTKSGLINFDFQTKQSEFGHLGAFIVLILASLILLWHQHVITFLLTTIINIVFNFYPVILQRKHRIQIERLTHKISS